MKSSKKEITLVAGLMLGLGLIFTYPLVLHFNSAIPYARFADGNIPVLKTGDHLQLYYWFWLLTDNLFGESSLFSNPYEFNMIGKQVSQGFHMFPFSLLFLIFTPFGDIFAYNATVILSFILAGVSMYLLVKFYTGSKTAALCSAIIFTFAPFRISQLSGSHLNGFNFFFFPLIVYLFELSYKRVSFFYSAFCGILIFSLSLMDSHLTYYLFIFLGIYIPVRLLLLTIKQRDSESYSVTANLPQWLNRSTIAFFLVLAGAGITLVLFSKMIITHDHNIPFFDKYFLYSLSIYPVLFILLGIFFTTFFYLFTPLKINQAFAIDVLSYLPLYLLSLYFIKFIYDIPNLGKILIALSLCTTFALKIVFFIKYATEGNQNIFNNLNFKQIIFTLAPILFFMMLSLLYIFTIKTSLLASSIAQEGRTFHDISLYSPRIEDIFHRTNQYIERYIYLGIIPIILGLSVPCMILFKIIKKGASTFDEKIKLTFLSFFALIFVLSYTISLGLSFKEMSLYKLFYYYFPYFNYSRSPSRMVIVSFFTLSILAGYAIKELQTRFKRSNSEKLLAGISILLASGILADYYTFKPMGITTISKGNDIYKYIKDNIDNKILLEIPLWPGDSHQSSLYEYNITLDRVKRVNGYSPVVSKEFIDTVFFPLYTLNSGRIDEDQYNLLNRLEVKYITIHNNRDVFPTKASPYPPLFTVRQFMNSPFVDFVKNNKDIYLFRVKDKTPLANDNEKLFLKNSAISNAYNVKRLRQNTGAIVYDNQIDNQVVWGSVKNDPMGFLTFGPYVRYPRGKYLAYFRLKINDNTETEPVVRIEVSSPHQDKETTLIKRDIRGVDFSKTGRYQDFYLYFDLTKLTRLEFKTYFYKKADVRIEKIVVSFADQEQPAPYFEAENLLGNTGEVAKDNLASGGKAIFADSKAHSPDYLIYGPHRKYPPGEYQVFYRMKIDRSNRSETGHTFNDIATIDVTSDSDQHILASRSLNISDFQPDNYQMMPLNFTLDRENELSFRVKFGKKINVWVDKVEIKPSK